MSLRAGRVGVAASEVDEQGHIIGAGGDSYTKAQTDALLLTKADKSTLVANSKEFTFAYDATTQKYGYKAGADGEFVPFDGAGGGQGLVLNDLVTTGLSFTDCTLVKGGYQILDGTLYIDVTIKNESSGNSNCYISGFPAMNTTRPYGLVFSALTENASILDNFGGTGSFLQFDSSKRIYSFLPGFTSARFVFFAPLAAASTTAKKAVKKTTTKK